MKKLSNVLDQRKSELVDPKGRHHDSRPDVEKETEIFGEHMNSDSYLNAGTRKERLAIIVANSKYANKNYDDLEGVPRDLREIKKLLEDSYVLKVFENSGAILDEVEEFIMGISEEELMNLQRTIFIYLGKFSGSFILEDL